MKVILIDPTTQEVSQVDYNGNYKEFYDLIGNGCTCFSAFDLPNGDGVYYDDEGLFHENIGGVFAEDWNYPVVGRLVIVGVDVEGNSIEPKMTMEEAKEYFKFLKPERLENYFEMYN